MRAFWRKGSKSKSNPKSQSNDPNSVSTSPRKKRWIFAESPLSNKVAATTSNPTPVACAHPLPHPVSLPKSVSVLRDDAPDLVIHRRQDATNTQRERKAMSASPRIHHVQEEKNRRYSEASISPRTSDFSSLGSDVSPSYGANLCSSPQLSLPNSRRHQNISLSPVHPDPHSTSGRQIDRLWSLPRPLPLPPGSSNGFYSGSNNSQWQKGKLLGRGTFGQVYQGFRRQDGHICVIKEVPVITDDNNSRECLKQLNQEISLLSQLKHPNIVQYYGSKLTDDGLSVFLECVSGNSIHKLLQEYGSFKEPVIRNYTRQILSGLAYLHRTNTVHRDINGANILVGTNGIVKLADFGLSKHILAYNLIKSLKGSPYWIAPEVVMNSIGYNPSVDIWGLGCMVIEMATSNQPWNQYEGMTALYKIANSKNIPDIPDHLSPDGKDFLRWCLRWDPANRPTATQLLEHPFVRDQSQVRYLSRMHSTPDPVTVSPESSREFYPRRSTSSLRDIDVKMSGRGSPGSPSFYSPNNQTSNISSMRANLLASPSPSHPYYGPAVPVNYSPPVNHSIGPMRSHGTAPAIDPWHEMAQLEIQSPYGSKRF